MQENIVTVGEIIRLLYLQAMYTMMGLFWIKFSVLRE